MFSSSKVKIRTVPIQKIETSNLPKGYTAAQKKQIKNDLSGYAYSCLQANSIQTVHGYLTAEKVSGMLGISDPTVLNALDELLAALSEGFDLPLYGKKNSIEAYAKEAGLTLPKTKYKTMDDAVAAFIAAQLSGDEKVDADSPLFRVLLVGVTAILRHEAAKKVSPLTDAGTVRALSKAASAVLSKLGFNDSTQTLGKKISADALLDLIELEVTDQLKKAVKEGLSEDNQKDGEDDLQKMHDKYVKKIDALLAAKEKEIMTV